VPAIWRWTAVLVHALRQALCPSPGLLMLIDATARGDLSLDLNDARRRRRVQGVSLAGLLQRWLLS
jgi:hypothetical protein